MRRTPTTQDHEQHCIQICNSARDNDAVIQEANKTRMSSLNTPYQRASKALPQHLLQRAASLMLTSTSTHLYSRHK